MYIYIHIYILCVYLFVYIFIFIHMYIYICMYLFMLADFLPSSKTHNFCAITYCCVVHTWGGVGWGGAITSNCTCTHTSCYASALSSRCCTHVMLRFCMFFSLLHTLVMLRCCTFFSMLHIPNTRHGTLLLVFSLFHTHTRHATQRNVGKGESRNLSLHSIFPMAIGNPT